EEGDWITIDGTDGTVYLEQLELEPSRLEKARLGDEEARKETIWKAFRTFMTRADEVRRLRVRANADTPEQARNARERGAGGIVKPGLYAMQVRAIVEAACDRVEAGGTR